MGLAPHWLDRGLNLSEQHWVSACIYARTNYFGQPIKISMRADNSNFPSLASDEEEQKEFSIFEGGFFGNLFTPTPTAYACTGSRTQAQNQDPIFKWRICANPANKNSPKISQCQFIITGKCQDKKSFLIDKNNYQEVIYVYLKPGLSSLNAKDGQ